MATRVQDNPVGLVIGMLVTWRVSHLLVEEDGPGHLMTRLRGAVDGTPLVGLLDCFGCTSVWVGAVAGLAVQGRRAPVVDVVLGGLAMSGAAFILQKLITKPESADWLPEPPVDSPLITVHD
jgi:hypothetical protein